MEAPTLLKPREAAAMLGISVRSTYRLMATGELPPVRSLRPAGGARIRPADLEAYIARRTAA